jgi:hypothetical protein
MQRNTATLTTFLRDPKRVIRQLGRGPVVLRRRDGESLRLSLSSTSESANEGAELVARLLADALGAPEIERRLVEAIEPKLPWIRLLPPPGRAAFLREFAETLEACASVGNTSALAELVLAWKATAALHGHPELAADLKRPLPGTSTKVPRPNLGRR